MSLLDDLPDPGRPLPGFAHRFARVTERISARMISSASGVQRKAVLRRLAFAGDLGTTDYEIARALDWSRVHVPGSRRGELIRDGWPIEARKGYTRPTDTSRPAQVWVLAEWARAKALEMTSK